MSKKIIVKGKTKGSMRLTGGAATKNMWMFRFKTKQDCIGIMWDIMDGPEFISPTISWRDAYRHTFRYSKEINPNGRMMNKEYFIDKLATFSNEKCMIQADGTDHGFSDKNKGAKRMCFLYYPQKNDRCLFLGMYGDEELSDNENNMLRQLAKVSDGWLRKEVG